MATIGETAKYVRSKNAGPFWMTIDIFCEDKDHFRKISESPAICPQTFAELYHANAADIKLFCIESLNVIKISIPKKPSQGYRYERDMHSGQQYVSLLDMML